MAKFVNNVTVTGTVEEVDLQRRVAQSSGREYIRGRVTIATSETNMVVVSIFQMMDKKDKKNPGQFVPDPRFNDVARLVNEHDEAAEGAIGTPINIASAFDHNVFVNQAGEMIEATQISGGFYNYSRTGAPRAEFKNTVVLRNIKEDIDRETTEPTGDLIITGETFAFNGVKIPMSFLVRKGPGADYFQKEMDNDNFPMLTDVWGNIENAQLAPKVVESAFGGPQVVESTFTRTLYVITGAAVEPHEMTEEIADKIKKGSSDYEVIKTEQQEYHDSRDDNPGALGGAATTPASGAADKPKAGGFNF